MGLVLTPNKRQKTHYRFFKYFLFFLTFKFCFITNFTLFKMTFFAFIFKVIVSHNKALNCVRVDILKTFHVQQLYFSEDIPPASLGSAASWGFFLQ